MTMVNSLAELDPCRRGYYDDLRSGFYWERVVASNAEPLVGSFIARENKVVNLS